MPKANRRDGTDVRRRLEKRRLIQDQPVIIHCYMTPEDITDSDRLDRLGSFCRRMGREARQGEVGLVIGDEYLAFRDFSKE